MGLRDCLDALLGRTSRKLTELKNLLGLTVSRVALLRTQRHSRFAQAQADVFHLLLLGNQDRALLRAELVIKEQNMIEVLNMVEGYCHLLTERAFLLHNQKECPEELREAAAGLVFAASRCGELPELRDVRRFFAARFGKEFTTAAAELRNHCGVSGKMVQKFSTRQPSLEIRAKVIKEITFQRGIKMELTESIPETAELYNDPKLQKDDSQTTMEPPAAAACDLQDFLVDEKLIAMAREKCKDAESAAQAAFESAAFAAIAARTAVDFFRSETQRRNSVDSSSLKRNSRRPEYAHSNSCCSSVDLGCRVSRVSSLQIESENPKSKEILSDESDDCDDELVRLASKPLGTMTRARSFAGLREHDFKFNNQLFCSRDPDVNENDDRMAIVAVEGNSVISSSSPNRISVRTRKMTY